MVKSSDFSHPSVLFWYGGGLNKETKIAPGAVQLVKSAGCQVDEAGTVPTDPEIRWGMLRGSAITSMAQYIRDHWVVNIQKIILNNFRDVGKGWFSIHETNQDTYRQGKLKKLLALDSVDDYCHGLEDPMQGDSLSRGDAAGVPFSNQQALVTSEFVERPRPKAAKSGGSLQLIPPGAPDGDARALPSMVVSRRDDDSVDLLPGSALFLLEIKISEEKTFVYSTSSEAAIELCAEILDMGMMSLGDIPQVEPQIVPQLFKTVVVKQVLNTIDVQTPRDEGAPTPFVKARKAAMLQHLRKALPALEDYIGHFASHEELLQLEPANFVQAKVDGDISTPEAKQCILEQQQKELEVLDSIPESVVIGLYEVSCHEIRKSFAGKHRKIQELLLDMLLTRFRDGAQEIVDGYSGIFSQLRKTPKDIEEVANMREYIATIPAEILKFE
ncbi:Dynein axonemal heavy chain 1 (Axonemal beta dynein heavy chain 1) (Ciliary dynein heavy chain 1) (mDHC7) [Durusdinium trenchii]|uniref:Dynein axonemal heavy chain 1 (Axonemal beta dynein heavy chain 1) (Ciliary dynein heavy chain 1) (MDHC7) n=1 Tax=Durusdinium trenchii TaxID=1381693 RepID=A0ABP0MGY8_9DINO